jgi:hypothetical protein
LQHTALLLVLLVLAFVLLMVLVLWVAVHRLPQGSVGLLVLLWGPQMLMMKGDTHTSLVGVRQLQREALMLLLLLSNFRSSSFGGSE